MVKATAWSGSRHRWAPVASLSRGPGKTERLWRTEALSAAISAFKLPNLLSPSCRFLHSSQAAPSSSPSSPRRFHSAISQTLSPRDFPCCSQYACACELSSSSLRSNSMASCVMSSSSAVAVASSVAAGAPRRAQEPANVILASRRGSTISGVALPPPARSGFRTEAKRSLRIVAAKATKEAETSVNDSVNDSVNEASAAAEDFLRSLTNAWEKSDDKPAIAGLGFAGLIGIWASFGLVNAIEKLPLIPDLFEIVGILFTGWFVYRYLLFKPDREELLKLVDEAKAKITGQ